MACANDKAAIARCLGQAFHFDTEFLPFLFHCLGQVDRVDSACAGEIQAAAADRKPAAAAKLRPAVGIGCIVKVQENFIILIVNSHFIDRACR